MQLNEMVLLQININTLHRNACVAIMFSDRKENFSNIVIFQLLKNCLFTFKFCNDAYFTRSDNI